MKRRSFLKSAAALFPAASLESFALPNQPISAPSEVHLVPAGQDRLGESHSRGFSSILFKVLPRETGNGLFVIEHANQIHGGPPLHMHPNQEEYFYIIEGEVVFQIGDSRKHLGPGDSLLGPRGIPHSFSHIGKKPGRMLIAFCPAGKMEQFLRDTAIPNPPAEDAAFYRRYDMEYLGPSPFAP
jgi:mannose-6-phosphate isomerase-like protein (cupin superfamily)